MTFFLKYIKFQSACVLGSIQVVWHYQKFKQLKESQKVAQICRKKSNTLQIWMYNSLGITLHEKWSFQLRISSVNMTKSAKLRIWSHLLKKSLIEKFIFCAVVKCNWTPSTVVTGKPTNIEHIDEIYKDEFQKCF